MYTEVIELRQEIVDIEYTSAITAGLLSVVEHNDVNDNIPYQVSLHMIGMESIKDDIKDAFNKVVEAIKKALNWMKEKIVSAYNKVVEFLTKIVNYIKDLFSKKETTSKRLEKLAGEYNG